MTVVRRVVTLAGDPDREAEVAKLLSAEPSVELLMRCMDRIELLAGLRGAGLDAVISVGLPQWFDEATADELMRAGVRIVGLVDDPLDASRLGHMGAGLLTTDAGVGEILERVSIDPPTTSARPSSQPSSPLGRLVAVWGPKGAPGRSSIAIELAYEIAAVEDPVLLIDGDPYGGDLLQMLGIVEEMPSIVWAAATASRDGLDAAQLEMELRRTSDAGPVLLPGLPRGELWPEVSEHGWRELLTVARSSFPTTIVDTGFCLESGGAGPGSRERNRMTRAVLTSADRIVALVRSDAIGIKNFLWAYEELRNIVEEDKIRIVANRVKRGSETAIAEIVSKHAGKRPVAYLPDDPRSFSDAIETGRSVREMSPGSAVSAALRSLAASLGAPVQRRGILSRLAGSR